MNISNTFRVLKTAAQKYSLAAVLLTAAFSRASAAPQVIIFDDFSSNTVGAPTFALDPSTTWVVDSGTFAANGESIGNFLPTAGQLNIGVVPGSQIHIDLSMIQNNTPVSVSFFLRQSDGAAQYWRGLNFGFVNTVSAQSYIEQASPSTAAFVPLGEGTSGFASYDDFGNLTAGLSGAHLLTAGGNDAWQSIEMIFNPSEGISVFQNDVLVSSWNNYLGLSTVDRFVITNQYGEVSWFVDDFTVIASVPEPSAFVLLGCGLAALAGWRMTRKRQMA